MKIRWLQATTIHPAFLLPLTNQTLHELEEWFTRLEVKAPYLAHCQVQPAAVSCVTGELQDIQINFLARFRPPGEEEINVGRSWWLADLLMTKAREHRVRVDLEYLMLSVTRRMVEVT